jgi:hypothetical protein
MEGMQGVAYQPEGAVALNSEANNAKCVFLLKPCSSQLTCIDSGGFPEPYVQHRQR